MVGAASRVPRRRRGSVARRVLDRLIVGRHAGNEPRLPAGGQSLGEQRVV